MTRFYTLIFSFIFLCGVLAQPGYRGKKLSVQYQPGFNINFVGVNSTGGEYVVIPNAIYHGGQLEYVVGRRTSIGARFAACQNHVNLYGATLDPKYYDNVSFIYSRLTDRKLEFIVKHFRKSGGNLSPLGTYTQFGLGKHFFNISSVKLGDTHYQNDNVYSLNLAFGKARIFFDCILLDMNLKFNYAFDVKNAKSALHEGNDIPKRTTRFLLNQNLIGFYIGLGFLAPKLKN